MPSVSNNKLIQDLAARLGQQLAAADANADGYLSPGERTKLPADIRPLADWTADYYLDGGNLPIGAYRNFYTQVAAQAVQNADANNDNILSTAEQRTMPWYVGNSIPQLNLAAVASTSKAWTTPDEAIARLEMLDDYGLEPVRPSEMQNIVEMHDGLWREEDLVAYFNANKKPGQKGIMVVAKTEFCANNQYMPCKVASTFIENSERLNEDYMVFLSWIHHPESFPSDPAEAAQKKLLNDNIVAEYDFVQGPGARIVFIDPAVPGRKYGTDAAEQDLLRKPIMDNAGYMPKFESTLDQIEKAWF